MADVRVNGKRLPILQSVDTLGLLANKLESVAERSGSVLTDLYINGRAVDFDKKELHKMKIDREDTVEAKIETPSQLSLESLRVAQDMAELLIFDIKVTTLSLWDGTKQQNKSLQTLLDDCHLFLSLAARPILLLEIDPYSLPPYSEKCLRQLDEVATHLEDATLLATHGKQKDACQVLVARVLIAVEKWMGLAVDFSRTVQELSEQRGLGASSPAVSGLASATPE